MLTPQQRAAQAAANSRMTPAMATSDPGLMTSMMGPGGGTQNGNGQPPRGPPTPQGEGMSQHPQMGMHHQDPNRSMDYSATASQIDAQRIRAMQQFHGLSNQQQMRDEAMQQQQQQQHQFAQPQPQRPIMQRSGSASTNPSQQNNNPNATGGMGPPLPQNVSSPNMRGQRGPSGPQPQQGQMQNQQSQPPPNSNQPQAPSPSAASNASKAAAEKPKKKETRQRKNSKVQKTPVMSAASANGTPGGSTSAGGAPPAGSTPVQQANTPASSSIPTPGRDASQTPNNGKGDAASNVMAGSDSGHAQAQNNASQQNQQGQLMMDFDAISGFDVSIDAPDSESTFLNLF